jgi:hypothetical protein
MIHFLEKSRLLVSETGALAWTYVFDAPYYSGTSTRENEDDSKVLGW